MTVRFTKHHGLGNDFLVLLDPAGDAALTPAQVVRLCDRRRGVGADGVLRATRPAVEAAGEPVAAMELFNADGSRAEMSGNGIRCLAQALLRAGWATPPEVMIATDAGVRTVSLRRAVDPVTDVLAVDMGTPRLGDEAPEWTGGPLRRAAWADLGNPHLVIEADAEARVEGEPAGRPAFTDADLVMLGEKVNASVPTGANVHVIVAGADAGSLTMRPYERGVGPTAACGTGACAAAAVAHRWGLVGDRVEVRMPGGTAEVVLGPTVQLVGPATFVAVVETEPAAWR